MKLYEIIAFVDNHKYDKRVLDKVFKSRHYHIYCKIIEKTSFLPFNAKLCERIFCLKNNICEVQICPVCKKASLKFNTTLNKYREYCSFACMNKSDKHKDMVKTKLKAIQAQITEKRLKTCLLKFGGNSPSSSSAIKEKIKQTKLFKYGDASFNNREKAKATCLKHFKVDNIFKSNHLQQQAIIARKTKSFNDNVLNPFFKTTPLFDLNTYILRKDSSAELQFKCNLCGHEFLTNHNDGKHKRCPKCFPQDWQGYSRSKLEIELYDFLHQLCGAQFSILQSDRSVLNGHELDIYIPEKKLAIEFNGLYWHSHTILRDKNYHLNKTELCEKQGIYLIHIFEDEWLSKQSIVKGKLQDILGLDNIVLDVSDCKISQINSRKIKTFTNNYNLFESDDSTINLGLFYVKNLVQVMSFKKLFETENAFEISCVCNKFGYTITNGSKNIIDYFVKNFKPSYLQCVLDRRWSTGKEFETLGFNLIEKTMPNKWYFKNNMTRFKDLSEKANYHTIYDCGNLKFKKDFS